MHLHSPKRCRRASRQLEREDALDPFIAICAAVLPGDGSAPEWVRLMPLGEIKARDGRAWTVKDAAAVVAASQPDPAGVMPVIDFDHATDAKEPGKPAPAAGWITEFQARADGIYARIEWTVVGADALAKRLYRYISPVFTATKTKEKDVIRILRAGLVNDPAIDQPALAKRESEDIMKEFLLALAKALGIKEDADEKAILAAVQKAIEAGDAGDAFRAQICKSLDLAEGAKVTEVAAALSVLKEAAEADPDEAPEKAKKEPAPGDDVAALKATVDDLQKQLASVQGDRARDTATVAVEAAVKARKITPAQKDWAVDYCTRDPEGFKAFVDKQPTLLADGRQATGEPGNTDAGGLTAEEKAICAQTGIAEADYLKTRKSEEA